MYKEWISTSALYGPYLAHHGIKGQKWGIRRYQNEDGTLTEEGKKRYNKEVESAKNFGKTHSELERLTRELNAGVPKGSKILVPTETKKHYEFLFNKFMKDSKVMNKKFDKMTSEIVTMDDGYDYIRTLIYDKKLGGAVEYLTLI